MAINRSFWILNGQKYHAKRKMAKNQLGLRPPLPLPVNLGKGFEFAQENKNIRILSFHMQNNLFVFSSEYTPMGCIYIKALKSYSLWKCFIFWKKTDSLYFKAVMSWTCFFFLNMWPITILQWKFHTYWFKLYICVKF